MSFHIYIFAICVRSGAPSLTQLTAGALTDPQLPVTASNVCAARDMSRLLEIWRKKSFFNPTHLIFTTFLLVLSIKKTGLYMRVSEKHGLGAHHRAC